MIIYYKEYIKELKVGIRNMVIKTKEDKIRYDKLLRRVEKLTEWMLNEVSLDTTK
nr:MAG TPA: hypothetical protein [Caudoviricetes sp.]